MGLSYELKGLKWTNTTMLIFAVCPKCHATKGNTNSINEGDLNENLESELKFQKVVHLIWYLAGVISGGSMKDQQVAAHCCNLAEGSIVEGKMTAPFLTSSVLEQGSSMRFFEWSSC